MQRRLIKFIPLALLVIFSAIDHAGAFGYRGNDWSHFDHQSVRISRVLSGDTFAIEDGTLIHLLGVDAPDPPTMHWSAESLQYLTARLKDRAVILRLDGTQTRDDAGNLLAYVYATVGDCVNVDLVRDGQAYADRRTKNALQPAIEQVESEARKKHRGLWNGLTDDQMPAWRLEWLRSLRKH